MQILSLISDTRILHVEDINKKPVRRFYLLSRSAHDTGSEHAYATFLCPEPSRYTGPQLKVLAGHRFHKKSSSFRIGSLFKGISPNGLTVCTLYYTLTENSINERC